MSYIERKKLLAEYDRAHKGPPGGARKLIVEAPDATDVVKVVRCEECTESMSYVSMGGAKLWCDEFQEDVPKDGFCYKGRREEVTDEKTSM